MNVENVAFGLHTAHALYHDGYLGLGTGLGIEKKAPLESLVDSVNSFRDGMSKTEFDKSATAFSKALSRVVKSEGQRMGLRHWQTPELDVPDDDGVENKISASVDGKKVAITQGVEQAGVVMTYALRRERNGVVWAGSGVIQDGEIIPLDGYSTAVGTQLHRDMLVPIIKDATVAFINGLRNSKTSGRNNI